MTAFYQAGKRSASYNGDIVTKTRSPTMLPSSPTAVLHPHPLENSTIHLDPMPADWFSKDGTRTIFVSEDTMS